MRVLVIGGTRFVGLAITRELLARGIETTVFHRSTTQPIGTEKAEHIQGDRDKNLDVLSGTTWDAVVDVCAYRPHQVDEVARVLGGRVNTYVFISTVSVYADDIPPHSNEFARLASLTVLESKDPGTVEMDGFTYGPLKVMCEESVAAHFPRHLIIRPTYVIGPDDYTNRFSAWVERISAGGNVDVPMPQDAPLQYIDARDLARFTVDRMLDESPGAFHVATPSGGTTFGEAIKTIASTIGGPNLSLNWIPVEEAKARAQEFPLWTEGEDTPMLIMSTEKALDAGLLVRPLAETIRDIAQEE